MTPITLPHSSNSGPPEFPGFTAASVCRKVIPFRRTIRLKIPFVTVMPSNPVAISSPARSDALG